MKVEELVEGTKVSLFSRYYTVTQVTEDDITLTADGEGSAVRVSKAIAGRIIADGDLKPR